MRLPLGNSLSTGMKAHASVARYTADTVLERFGKYGKSVLPGQWGATAKA